MRIWQVGLLGLALGIGAARAQEPVPVGEEFQINTYTTGYQTGPSVAVADEGDFVVVWQSGGDYYSGPLSIQGQLYDASGSPVGEEFQINSYTTGAQGTPAVAVQPRGDFVVVWSSPGSFGADTSYYSIQAQRYAADGTPAGEQFQINSYTTNDQASPGVATDTEGDFVVVWRSWGSYGTDTDAWSIQAQRYDADGTPAGEQFQVNSYTTSAQRMPAVAVQPQGDFVVIWNSYGSFGTDTSYGSIQAQRYDASGTPLGGQFQVNSYTSNVQWYPAVAFDSQGDFVVVWFSEGSYGTDTSYGSIQAQRYATDGTPAGGQFQVNTFTTSGQGDSAVAADTQGNFVVVWRSWGSYGTDTSYGSIQAQRYDADGSPAGEQFQVNTFTTSDQRDSAVAADTQGNFVVVWESWGSYGTDSDYSIQGQRYSFAIIFPDGFESGDTSAWSSTVE